MLSYWSQPWSLLQGDPNSAVAFDYLPGSVLRGIFIGKYLGSQSADASDSTLRRLFFDGTTRYLNGYPLDDYKQPSLPVPASWQQVKGTEKEIFDFAVKAPHDDQQWQPISVPFYTLSSEGVQLIRPARNVAVHTQRTARFGRAMPEYPPDSSQAGGRLTRLLGTDEIAGAVYRYDALAAGQIFQAAIICDNDADESTLRTLIGGCVIIGGSRSGGYGRAEIRLATNDVSNHDAAEDADEDELEDKLIVILQSDVLLRDTRGQFAVDSELLRQVLGKHLGVELELKDAFLGTKMVGGFNRKWRLPLPQALAVRMGSVLIFKDPGCDQARLDDLEARGIGERRAEGFGRIVFNRQRATKLKVADDTPKKCYWSVEISDTEAHNLAKLMVNRMLRQRLDERLLAAANAVKVTNPPSNAQIASLRGLVLEELCKATPDTSKLCQFINSIETRSSARRQFERSTVGKKPLLHWLKDLLRCDRESAWTMDDNDWKALLGLNGGEGSTKIGSVRAEIDNALRLEYVLRFIDLVLAQAAKLRGKEN